MPFLQKTLTPYPAVASCPPSAPPALPAFLASLADEAGEGANLLTPDDLARSQGFTRLVFIEGGCGDGEFLIRPDTDLDSSFRAWGVDWQEWTTVHGSNVLIQELETAQ